MIRITSKHHYCITAMERGSSTSRLHAPVADAPADVAAAADAFASPAVAATVAAGVSTLRFAFSFFFVKSSNEEMGASLTGCIAAVACAL